MTNVTTARGPRAEREFVLGQSGHYTILTTGEDTDGRHDLILGVKAPGSATPLHLHTRYEERLFVLDGSLTIWAGNEKVVLSAGDFYVIPTDVAHMIQAGPDGARALNISSPAGFAELVQRGGTPAASAGPETEIDEQRFTAVTTELGDVILGPPGTLPDEVTR
jgi:quercetin dioxygenase-like cupin family protein